MTELLRVLNTGANLITAVLLAYCVFYLIKRKF